MPMDSDSSGILVPDTFHLGGASIQSLIGV